MIDRRILPSGEEDMQEALAYSISRRMSLFSGKSYN